MARYTLVLLFSLVACHAQNLTQPQLDNVLARLADGAKQSWELGTRAQALLELTIPNLSVFSDTPLPPPQTIPSEYTSAFTTFLSIPHGIISALPSTTSGPTALLSDGSAADPASNGVAVIIANWTGQQGDYATAATNQLEYLFQKVPKTPDGAISHRTEQVQLWSDFIYMVPPFLAYYGVITQNQSLLQESYNQISLYRSYLRDPSANNLWKHILLGDSGLDEGHWSTGNGWAAAGMLRVLATMKRSKYSASMKNQQNDLVDWIEEIHDGMYPHANSSTQLFLNYPDEPASSTNFPDSSSTALLASTVYRLSLLASKNTHIASAENARKALSTNHFTSDGWLTPVVDPHAFGQQGSQSPEGQAFVVEMQAAYMDWVKADSKGVSAGVTLRVGKEVWWAVAGVVGVMGLVV